MLVATALYLALLASAVAHSSSSMLDPSAFNDQLTRLQGTANTLVADLSRIDLSLFNLNHSLDDLNADVSAFRDAVESLAGQVEEGDGPLTLDPTMLSRLGELSGLSASLAQGLESLSGQVVSLSPLLSSSTLDSVLKTILRLSDDIGVMADRILEMADKILVMADNIGLMADRILATQVLQNQNVALVTAAMLETQKNMLALASMFKL